MFSYETTYEQRSSSLLARTYGWMCCALMATASSAYYVLTTPTVLMYMLQPPYMFGLMLAQIIMVIVLSAFINRMSFFTALILFVLYALSLGVTLTPLFLVYTYASLVSTFLTAAVTFGIMSFYGYITRSDLTSMGNLARMAVWGLIVGMIINYFLRSAQFDYIMSGMGVIAFVLLTAYDTQKLKNFFYQYQLDKESGNKISLLGALTLYLDFINIFLFLLRFMGKRNQE